MSRITYAIAAGIIGAIVPLALLYDVPLIVYCILFVLSLPGLCAWQLVYILRGNTHGVAPIVAIIVNGGAYAAIAFVVPEAWRRKAEKRKAPMSN